ncbi:beta-glucosidase [Anaerosporobacter sp.]|uniref:beta-glucosidase n=1 Tax=Anaerosporobacter sp. TaxID=1872529 RepID=UPI00286EFCBA|nr:glycoside hydrolase family 3 C-terminal domain-containing protein [Anaerosporobacter sp.]
MKKLSMEQERHIESLLEQLTLEEKIGMIHGNGLFKTAGVERLGIPELKFSDGPMGVRNDFENANWKTIGLSYDAVSYLPSNTSLASSWNREAAYQVGQVLGEEARGRGKDMILAPGINIKRSPLCGRNFEYMSEDPYLIKELAVPLIKGVQESDVAACVKHFAANSQETKRLEVEAIIDDRAFRELYLPAFEAAVEESYSIMGAYNRYKGEHCCHSKCLLDDILREEWGYDGVVVSDWGGVHDTKQAAGTSLDIEMSVTYNFDEYFMANPLLEAVKRGEIAEERIDAKVRRILMMMERMHVFDGERKAGTYNTPEHREVIRKAAEEGVVLLKNENNRLPLSKNVKKLAVIGQNGDMIHSNGGGSAEIKSLYEISPLLGINMLLGGNTEITYASGYYIEPKKDENDVNWQESSLEDIVNRSGKVEEASENQVAKELLEEAVRVAKEADEVIIIGGLNHDYDTEGGDRNDLVLPYGQDEVIKAVLEVKPEAVVVMIAGSPVEMRQWEKDAKAIVWTSYAGMEGGSAIAKVLFGDVNPSGKLPESFPITISDSPAHCIGEFPGDLEVRHTEGIQVGYRYYVTKKVPTQFCFGHGLSYTTFTYDDLKIDNSNGVTGQVRITNTGKCKGAEVVQIYVSPVDSKVERPELELKAFDKVMLEPNESKIVTFSLGEEAFSYYNVEEKAFVQESGEYNICVGSSCEDIRVKAKITL